eukprot:330298-Amphidinium_carterae.3
MVSAQEGWPGWVNEVTGTEPLDVVLCVVLLLQGLTYLKNRGAEAMPLLMVIGTVAPCGEDRSPFRSSTPIWHSQQRTPCPERVDAVFLTV